MHFFPPPFKRTFVLRALVILSALSILCLGWRQLGFDYASFVGRQAEAGEQSELRNPDYGLDGTTKIDPEDDGGFIDNVVYAQPIPQDTNELETPVTTTSAPAHTPTIATDNSHPHYVPDRVVVVGKMSSEDTSWIAEDLPE
jgi:hypothetical protein